MVTRAPAARVGAVRRSGQGGDGRRSGASFGARAGAAGGTHNTGCRARFRMLFGRRWRPPALAPVAAPQPGTSGAVAVEDDDALPQASL
jgi:hypothetical protein